MKRKHKPKFAPEKKILIKVEPTFVVDEQKIPTNNNNDLVTMSKNVYLDRSSKFVEIFEVQNNDDVAQGIAIAVNTLNGTNIPTFRIDKDANKIVIKFARYEDEINKIPRVLYGKMLPYYLKHIPYTTTFKADSELYEEYVVNCGRQLNYDCKCDTVNIENGQFKYFIAFYMSSEEQQKRLQEF